MEEQQRHRLEAQLEVNRVDLQGNKQAEISQETKEETKEEIR